MSKPFHIPRSLKIAGICIGVVLGCVGLGMSQSLADAIRGRGENSPKTLSDPRPVAVGTVVSASPVGRSSYPGTVKASRTTKLAFRVGGPLVEVCVRPGDVVEQGQVLMRIDPRDFEDAIAAVMARIAAAEANLGAMKAGARDEDIRSLEARLGGAQARATKARHDHDRAKTLFSEQVIAPSEYDRARSMLDVAEATVVDFEQVLRKARAGARKEDIIAAAAAIRGLRTELRIAQHQLDDTLLRAPYSGVVTRQFAENHEMVESGEAVLGMHDIDELEIEISVPEIELIHRQVGHEYISTAVFPAIPGRVCEVRVREWNTEADPITRTYSVTFVMKNPDDVNILPGMTAEVSRQLKGGETDRTELPVVPASAICSDGNSVSFVWLFDDKAGRASRRPVTLGRPVDGSRLTVLSGLVPGDRIVVAGADLVSADMNLRAMD
ncbi:MAG: efflux RND transporter periplasmic adaptor subunit [Lentisphaeria bacterium]|nr:efflux RND transporter periplasmic adaptor subunit [Lentisphaeria bacterium]